MAADQSSTNENASNVNSQLAKQSRITARSSIYLSSFTNYARSTAYTLIDLPHTIGRDPMIPPLRLRRIIGQSDNYTTNRATLLKEYCSLTQNSSVLDVGCGCGSLAYSLLRYYNFKGSYDGFDIIEKFISWLKKSYSQYPNFRFKHANIYNHSYNKKGDTLAADFSFPYASNTFDVIFLNSIFTHMLPDDMIHYFSEIHRVLKPNGNCAISYFLLSNNRPSTLSNDPIRERFHDSGKGYFTTNPAYPEDATAYPEDEILALYTQNKLQLTQSIIYGGLQDVIVAQKALDCTPVTAYLHQPSNSSHVLAQRENRLISEDALSQ
jgi:SAM-dependent methyltransferase